MHPPPFRSAHHLSDWPECQLELHCCRGMTFMPVRLLMQQRSFGELLPRLRCRKCGQPPAPAYLCAGHREHNHGAPPDWAIELGADAKSPTRGAVESCPHCASDICIKKAFLYQGRGFDADVLISAKRPMVCITVI